MYLPANCALAIGIAIGMTIAWAFWREFWRVIYEKEGINGSRRSDLD